VTEEVAVEQSEISEKVAEALVGLTKTYLEE
jgi:hypothetical protein